MEKYGETLAGGKKKGELKNSSPRKTPKTHIHIMKTFPKLKMLLQPRLFSTFNQLFQALATRPWLKATAFPLKIDGYSSMRSEAFASNFRLLDAVDCRGHFYSIFFATSFSSIFEKQR
jgi:hypothetical protein